MVLVDTSAWIEFQRATGSAADKRLSGALEGGDRLATTGVVLMEFLAGARDAAQAAQLRRLLARCEYVPVQEPSDFEMAADLYRACRAAGETVRRLPDCLIAAVAIRSGLTLLHADTDFTTIGRHSPLVTE